MEKVLAMGFSFVVFVIGLAFLITGRVAIGLLLLAVSLFLVFMAFRKKETVIIEQKIDIGGEISSQITKMQELRCRIEQGGHGSETGRGFYRLPLLQQPIPARGRTKMVKQIKCSAVLLLLALAFSLPGAAADYYFKVDALKAVLTVQPDSLVEIRYAITFSPEAGQPPHRHRGYRHAQ